jgi:hypothetical protein
LGVDVLKAARKGVPQHTIGIIFGSYAFFCFIFSLVWGKLVCISESGPQKFALIRKDCKSYLSNLTDLPLNSCQSLV